LSVHHFQFVFSLDKYLNIQNFTSDFVWKIQSLRISANREKKRIFQGKISETSCSIFELLLDIFELFTKFEHHLNNFELF
jgi:hypothetical protein